MRVKIYVEGGGKQNKDLAIRCREGFRKFFDRAGLPDSKLRIIPCGSRHQAYRDFKDALQSTAADEFAILLVDSEGPVAQRDPWNHLLTQAGAGWKPPTGVGMDHLHLMVQAMEAWFFADKAAIGQHFGPSLRVQALSANMNVEHIPKADLLSQLKKATKECSKGTYSKGGHSFVILGMIDPQKVKTASPVHGARLLETLDRICAQ